MAVINMETIEGLSKLLNICRHVLPEPRFAFIGLEPSEVAIAKKKPVIQPSVSFLSNNTLAYSSVEFPRDLVHDWPLYVVDTDSDTKLF